MAYSLRLPDALDVQARQRSGQMGISLNSLICVALDAYLKPSDLVASVKPATSGQRRPGGLRKVHQIT